LRCRSADERVTGGSEVWRRRCASIPLVLATTALAGLAIPVVVPLLTIADLTRGRGHLPSARMYLVIVQYLWNDTVEILAAPVLWVAAGFGTRVRSPASVARYERLQRWSVRTIHRRAAQLLGVRLLVEGRDQLEPGPVIVLSHHVHIADAALPAYLYLVERDWHLRGVLMAELLADPGFDLIYQRTGHVFIDRSNPETAQLLVVRAAAGLDRDTALVIFPEGRLFRPQLRDEYLARLAAKDPDRARDLAGLRHLLPPRPGGVLSLLNAVPDADVVVIAHVGLENIPILKRIARAGLPRSIPVRIQVRRIPRGRIPTDRHGRVKWLDQTWRELDDAVSGLIDDPSRCRTAI
jgi:1-acyl-sn-glycerol-3-phosphate acyltransferase